MNGSQASEFGLARVTTRAKGIFENGEKKKVHKQKITSWDKTTNVRNYNGLEGRAQKTRPKVQESSS